MSTLTVTTDQPMPTWRDIARGAKQLAVERGEWAGYPMPVQDLQLQLEPRFPLKMHMDWGKADGVNETPDLREVVNTFWCTRLRVYVCVLRDAAGRSDYQFSLSNPVDMMLGTVMASEAWLPEAEQAALDKLASLVNERQMFHYISTGMFLESSKRSKVMYVFRRLRPTIALRGQANGSMRILCSLCLHPVGYYKGTWAGCQTPTDDVVSHLCMMRGDEPKFWANANQHPAYMPSSGI